MEILIFIIMIPFIMSSILLGVAIWALYYLVQTHREYQQMSRGGYSNDDEELYDMAESGTLPEDYDKTK